MTTTDVPVGGNPSTLFEASVNGSGRVLADGNDATYVTINPTSGRIDATLDSQAIPYLGAGAVADPDVDVLLKVTGPDPGVSLYEFGYGGLMNRDTSVPTEILPGGWRRIRMLYSDPARVWLGDTSQATLILGTPGTGTVLVYEATVRFTYLQSLVAPPCRMFPRDDDVGVGAGRNFPPPRSRQRSSRGVGYY